MTSERPDVDALVAEAVDAGGPTVEELLAAGPDDVTAPTSVSYARNVFLPLTTACVNSCDYCAFYDDPGDVDTMTPDEVRDVVDRGVATGCTEALFSFGTRPEGHDAVRRRLDAEGHANVIDYLEECCELALDRGLLPHTNAGLLARDELARLRRVNASMGLMLETTADVPAHEGWATKKPERRLRHIDDAGDLGVPFTTGFLIGLGESWRDRAEAVLAVRALHERHGHVQEVIVQNVVPNERSDYDRPATETMRRAVAMARRGLPDDVEVQVPPNLTPDVPALIDAGVGDLGGVSPVTDDHVNPDYAWPALDELRETADEAGVALEERLPVYERYVGDERWMDERVEDAIERHDALGDVLYDAEAA
jgi:FO synthase subunit 1